MSIIVKMGGCNGSGKTSVARSLIEDNMTPATKFGNGKRVTAYQLLKTGRMWSVLGNYENVCGGMDTISDKYERLDLVKKWGQEKGNDVVFFEGLITGKTYGAFGEMSETDGNTWLYVFLDTPFDVCVKRVLQRRKAAGNTKPFDPERTMRPTFKAVKSVLLRAGTAGHRTLVLDHTQRPVDLAKVIVKAVNRIATGVKK